jgi:hypothetical protein
MPGFQTDNLLFSKDGSFPAGHGQIIVNATAIKV